MAEPPKFTPKKRPKSCMQGSDDGSDTTVEDLCRKKFKPIAPKPFLQKDSHQSMLTTVLPVKQPPQSDTKDATTFSLADTNTNNISVSSCSKTGKYGDDLQSMPVMYGGPVFIPVRFPFPVLVPAMFNVNGNQQEKCTCYPTKETLKKPGQPPEGIEAKPEGEPQQSCPVHYSFKSSQPTYINTPLPNVQSSFMPMYMSSGSGVATKGDWSGKPKYNRYKYSMLKNGDIYKGMASSFQNYGDWNQSVNCSQFPGDFLPYNNVNKKQYSGHKLHTETTNRSEADQFNRTPCYDTPCSVASTIPSKCDIMCQTSVQNTVGQSVAAHGGSHSRESAPSNRVVGVDAAVQTDNQEIETAGQTNISKQRLNDAMGKQCNSSSVQCSLPSSMQKSPLIPEPGSHNNISTVTSVGASPASAVVGGRAKSANLRLKSSASEQGTSTLSSSSAFTTPSHTSIITSYGSSSAGNKQNHTIPSSATAVPSRDNRDHNLSVLPTLSGRPHPDTGRESRDEDAFNGSSSRRMQRTIFSSESEVSTSSEALQQRNYETDVIVPLRAAPSPSDAHDSEDMDRFVLSPVISESDSEDIFNRQLRPSAGFFRQPQDRQTAEALQAATPSLARNTGVPSLNAIRTSSLPSNRQEGSHSLPPTIVHAQGRMPHRWPTPLYMQGHESQFQNSNYPAAAVSTSVGFPIIGAHTATVREHMNLYSTLTSTSSYPPALPSASSPYVTSSPFLREPQNSLLHPTVRSRSHHAYSSIPFTLPTQTFTSSATSRECAEFPSSRVVPVTAGAHVTRMPIANTNQSHTDGRKESSQASDHSITSQTREERSKENSDHPNDKVVSEAHERGRFGAHIQSVPLQSNIAAGHVRGEAPGHRLQRKDGTNVLFPTMEGSSEHPFMTVGHNIGELASSSNGRSSVSLHNQHRREPSTGKPSGTHHHSTVVSSSTGYPMSYVPSIGCRNSVPPIQMHEPSTHPMHGFSQRPISGTGITMHGPPMSSGISPPHNRSTHPHPFQPRGTYHGQHGHMYYSPHYGGLHQPLSMPTNPPPSHSDLSLLSPRSCAHLHHIHGNMLHSPQMPSSMHNFQRPAGFSSGLHTGSYPYPAHEDRLDTCCSSRLGHSPPREDRSIPTLLTNILHRRPGAFSHLERTAYVDHTDSSSRSGARPTQAAAVVAANVATTSTVTSSVQNRPSTSSTSSNLVSTVSATFTTTDAMAVHNQSGPSSVSRPPAPAVATTSSASSSKARNSLNNVHSAQSSNTESTKVCSLPSASVSSPAVPLITSSSHQTSSPTSTTVTHLDNATASASTPPDATLPIASPSAPPRSASRSAPGNNSDKYLPVEAIPPSPASSTTSVPTPDNGRQNVDQVIKYGETVLKCSRQILRESGRTVLCCWSCDYHTAEPRKMHRHQKRETQHQKCQLCDFKSDTRCKVNQHYKEEHMDKDDPFRSVNV